MKIAPENHLDDHHVHLHEQMEWMDKADECVENYQMNAPLVGDVEARHESLVEWEDYNADKDNPKKRKRANLSTRHKLSLISWKRKFFKQIN